MQELGLSAALACVLSARVPDDARGELLRAGLAHGRVTDHGPRGTDHGPRVTDGGAPGATGGGEGDVVPLRRPDDPGPAGPRAA